MIEEVIKIQIGDKIVDGIVRKPQGKGEFPTIVIVSGFGMDLHEWKNSNDEVSQRLVRQGFLTVQFNFSVVGSNRELALSDRANELTDVVNWVKKRPDVDSEKLGIHATSFGTLTVMEARLRDVGTLVFVSGIYDRAQTFKKEFIGRGATIHYDTDTELPRSSGKKTVVGPEFWPSLDQFDPIARLREITAPLLMIHGDHDKKVDTATVESMFANVGSLKKKLKIFKGGDHGITDVPDSMRQDFLTEVVKWFRKTID